MYMNHVHVLMNMTPWKAFHFTYGSVSKALADKPDEPEFYPLNLQGRRREPTLTSCPLTTKCRFMPTHTRNVC